jgi:hypothetical protein
MVLYIFPSELFIVFPDFSGFFNQPEVWQDLCPISPEEEKSENFSAENSGS